MRRKAVFRQEFFDAVYKNNDISNSSALTRLYNQDNPDLYSKNQIAQFDSLCKEYLKGNNMQYDEALIHNTAVKAAQAYSDCFGLKNTEAIADLSALSTAIICIFFQSGFF